MDFRVTAEAVATVAGAASLSVEGLPNALVARPGSLPFNLLPLPSTNALLLLLLLLRLLLLLL